MSDDEIPLPPHGRPPKHQPTRHEQSCSVCGNSATPKDLSTYGARCFACYQAYCRNAFSTDPRFGQWASRIPA